MRLSNSPELCRDILLDDRHPIQFVLAVLCVGHLVVLLEMGDIFGMCKVFLSGILEQ